MKVDRVVLNGCSYMWDLSSKLDKFAQVLAITHTKNLVVTGSCNSRIIRTTIKDSYTTSIPSLYVIGLSFLGRTELPISAVDDSFERSWMSLQNSVPHNATYNDAWAKKDTETFINLKLKSELYSISDRLEDLIYILVSLINDFKSIGHQIVIFRQANDVYCNLFQEKRFNLFQQPEIVQGLQWGALLWQFENGAIPDPRDDSLELDIRHVLNDQNDNLLHFLSSYIVDQQFV